MALIVCSECGKTFSDKASACPNCGCPVQGNEEFADNNTSTDVNVTNTPTLENYKVLAERYYKKNDFPNALYYYEKITELDPDDYEAVFDRGYCQTMSSSLLDFDIEAVSAGATDALNIMSKRNDIPKQVRDLQLECMFLGMTNACRKFYIDALNCFNDYPNVRGASEELRERLGRVVLTFINAETILLLRASDDNVRRSEKFKNQAYDLYKNILGCYDFILKVYFRPNPYGEGHIASGIDASTRSEVTRMQKLYQYKLDNVYKVDFFELQNGPKEETKVSTSSDKKTYKQHDVLNPLMFIMTYGSLVIGILFIVVGIYGSIQNKQIAHVIIASIIGIPFILFSRLMMKARKV